MPQPQSLRLLSLDDKGERFALQITSRCACVTIEIQRATMKRLHADIGDALAVTRPYVSSWRSPIDGRFASAASPPPLTPHED